jgi:hypothetical protein
VRELLDRFGGDRAAAQALSVDARSLVRIVAAQAVTDGTVALVRQRIRELRESQPSAALPHLRLVCPDENAHQP